jgi:hypothetical protein
VGWMRTQHVQVSGARANRMILVDPQETFGRAESGRSTIQDRNSSSLMSRSSVRYWSRRYRCRPANEAGLYAYPF